MASNRQAETWIKEGRIKVDGETVTTPGMAVDPSSQEILLDGKPLRAKEPPKVYWLLNKPDRVLATRSSDAEKDTIFDLPALRKIRFPLNAVDRLDFRSEGLQVLTNDGELVDRVARHGDGVEREYQVLLAAKLTHQQQRDIKTASRYRGEPVPVTHFEFLQGKRMGATRGSWYFLRLKGGTVSVVRSLFEHHGVKVVRLIRTGFGVLGLSEDIEPGNYRQLTSTEIRAMKKVGPAE